MNGILTVAVDGTNYNLLDDYGKIMDLQVEAAQMACNTVDASPRAKQNSQMMYKCLMASTTKEAKSALASKDQDFHEGGLSLFYHVVSQLFTATFSNAQVTCDNLSDFHLKWFRYNVIQVNNYISSTVMTLKAAFSWRDHHRPGNPLLSVQGLQEDQGSGRVYDPHPILGIHGNKHPWLHSGNPLQRNASQVWKPSDKTPEEQTLAMVAQQQQAKKGSNNSTKSKPSSGQSSKTKEKDKKTPHLPNHLANWAIPNSGMARHTTGALPTTSTPIGIPTRWRSATPIRK